jgi:hypothetical protein
MSAMVFLPPTRRRDDERRAPFAQVRLAASVLVRAEALVAKEAPLKERRTSLCRLFRPRDIRNTTGVTSKFIGIGPAWPDTANKNKSAKRINDLIANTMPRFEALSSTKVRCRKTSSCEGRSTHRHPSTRIRDRRE